MKIFFVSSERAILPEIVAYRDFFTKRGWVCENIKYSALKKIKDEYHIVWIFMGLNLIRPKNKIVVHEYSSLSVGRFPKLKNFLKKILNCKPDVRVFQNRDVEKEMNFKDKIPSFYRDMAVSNGFGIEHSNNKEFDFIYCGAINNERRLDTVLDEFILNKRKNIVVLGKIPKEYYEKYGSYKNINLVGEVDYSNIPQYLRKSRVGINIIEDKYPYNIQTSTKILEYLSCGLGVYTTCNNWCLKYEESNDVKFSYFKIGLFDVNVECYFDSKVKIRNWEDVINASKIDKYLERFK